MTASNSYKIAWVPPVSCDVCICMHWSHVGKPSHESRSTCHIPVWVPSRVCSFQASGTFSSDVASCRMGGTVDHMRQTIHNGFGDFGDFTMRLQTYTNLPYQKKNPKNASSVYYIYFLSCLWLEAPTFTCNMSRRKRSWTAFKAILNFTQMHRINYMKVSYMCIVCIVQIYTSF